MASESSVLRHSDKPALRIPATIGSASARFLNGSDIMFQPIVKLGLQTQCFNCLGPRLVHLPELGMTSGELS
jgi:hypothetical protein